MEPEVPVLIMAFIRPDLLRKSIRQLSKFSPPILYVVGDGPRNPEEEELCLKSREIAMNPDWDCEVIPLFSDTNQGLVPSFISGMDRMFSDHEFGVFLEDDVLLSESFYQFAKELLLMYRDDPRVGHINASNFIPNFDPVNYDATYFFSNHPHVWGFATWKRMWESYDIGMPLWKKVNQRKILSEHCFSWRERRSLKRMFDLHCQNPDPWACDYQWIFNCLHKRALSVTPKAKYYMGVLWKNWTKNQESYEREVFDGLGEKTIDVSIIIFEADKADPETLLSHSALQAYEPRFRKGVNLYPSP